ncbi:hypothetical protein C1H46_025852 [Malus baccata]|uniref:Uncharacterized protein n=1 Tax=Malus baccata TaxID=106549 RepID=A0A540LQ53_MALBA|nr:hypothetical protein C1H46_025852 [Malus baccata]
MFKFKNGYSKINAADVQRIYGIPNSGKQAPQSTKDSRTPMSGENKFVDKYFSNVKRINRKNISDSIDVAFAAGTKEGNEDAACLIILYLLFTLLLGSSAAKLPWSFAKSCNSIENISQYNWAKETQGVDRAQRRKKDKQPTVSGSVVILMEEGASQDANEDHFDVQGDNQNIFGTQIPNEHVQDVEEEFNYPNLEGKERIADFTDTKATETDGVINDAVNFRPSTIDAESVPQMPVQPQVQEAKTTEKETEGVPIQPKESVVKTRKHQRFYECLLEPLTGEENWEYENYEEELTQEELTQSQTDPAEYWKKRAKLHRQLLNNAINTCHSKNTFIQKIVQDKDTLEKEKKQLEKEKNELEWKNIQSEQQKKQLEEKKNELQEQNKGMQKEKNELEWNQEESYKKMCETNEMHIEKIDKLEESLQVLNSEKMSLDDIVKKQEQELQVLNSEKMSLEDMVKKQEQKICELNKTRGLINGVGTESEKVDSADKVIIVSDKDQTSKKQPTESEDPVQPKTQLMVRNINRKSRKPKDDVNFGYPDLKKRREQKKWARHPTYRLLKKTDKDAINYFLEKAGVDIYWHSEMNEFSYYFNIVMKEDFCGFLGDERVPYFNKHENESAKMKELKYNLGKQLDEQTRVAKKIFIPLLTHEHYTLLVLDTEKRHFYFYNSNRKNLQEGETNIHNKNAYTVVKMVEEWYNNATFDYIRRSPTNATFGMDEDKNGPLQLGS